MSFLNKRLHRLFLTFTLLAVALTISACGGGGEPSASIGQFVDSFVQGVGYESISYQGITDAEGYFEYKPGEETTFSIGSIICAAGKGDVQVGAASQHHGKRLDDQVAARLVFQRTDHHDEPIHGPDAESSTVSWEPLRPKIRSKRGRTRSGTACTRCS